VCSGRQAQSSLCGAFQETDLLTSKNSTIKHPEHPFKSLITLTESHAITQSLCSAAAATAAATRNGSFDIKKLNHQAS